MPPNRRRRNVQQRFVVGRTTDDETFWPILATTKRLQTFRRRAPAKKQGISSQRFVVGHATDDETFTNGSSSPVSTKTFRRHFFGNFDENRQRRNVLKRFVVGHATDDETLGPYCQRRTFTNVSSSGSCSKVSKFKYPLRELTATAPRTRRRRNVFDVGNVSSSLG